MSRPLPRSALAMDERWQEALRRLEQCDTVCIDLETSGLDWKRNHIVGWVFAFGPRPDDSYYLPVRHAGGGNIKGYRGPQTATGWDGRSLHPIEPLILKALSRPRLYQFGHNFGFDLKFMWRLGLDQRLEGFYEDTQVNAALINEHAGSFSLKMLCQDSQVQWKRSEQIRAHIKSLFPEAKAFEEMEHFWRLAGDDHEAVEYARGDGTSTWQLRDWQWEELAKQHLQKVWDIECRLLPVLTRMSCRGIRVDEERCHELLQYASSGQFEREMGFEPDFNCKAPSQVQAWLEQQGVTQWGALLKNGKPQLNEAFLETIEPGRKIIELRRLRTLRDSFLKPMLATHLWNGRCHPNYHQSKVDEYGVVTGRLSCSDPNLQQASKRNPKIGRMHRSIFIPDEGKVWGSADYAQCEPVLLAEYSRAKVLMDGFWRVNAEGKRDPVDAHSAVTRATNRQWAAMTQEEFDASGLARTPEFKAAREIGKRVNQTLITGGGQGVLVTKYKVPKDEVAHIWTEYFRALPEVKRLQNDSTRTMKKRGYVRSLLGRKARLEHRSRAYVALNRLLQCGNADILKLKMVQIDEYLRDNGRPVDLLNNVHDSLDFQFEPEMEAHYEECLNIMQDFSPGQPIVLHVPLGIDEDRGENWAIATFGAEK